MAIDWSTLYDRFKGLWVALGDDEKTVLASGQTAQEALRRARQGGHPNPILTRLPETLGTYVGRL
jgi:hypothetical protein